MIKLKYMKNQSRQTRDNYRFIRYTTYDIEMKTDLIYLNKIVNPGYAKPDFLNLIRDYLKLKGIYNSVNNFNQVQFNELLMGLENKINLIELGCYKAETFNNQEDFVLDKMLSDVKVDLTRLKDKYIN